jgi:hypothetical protein
LFSKPERTLPFVDAGVLKALEEDEEEEERAAQTPTDKQEFE